MRNGFIYHIPCFTELAFTTSHCSKFIFVKEMRDLVLMEKSNVIQCFQELVLPVTTMARNFEKLRRWENPYLTISYLGLAYAIIFRY